MYVTQHPHLTFSIAELHSSDPARSADFYGELMNWTLVEDRFQFDGRDVAALRHRPSANDQWLPCVSVESIDHTTARARELGAKVVDTTIHDLEGTVFGLRESQDGAQLIEEVGSLWWIEVLTNRPADAANFYTSLFGWSTSTVDLPPVGRYTVFKLGETQVCGLLQIGHDWGVPPRWNVIYHVADCDAAIRHTQQLGGRLEFVHNVPRAGRIATLYDSGGALFVIRGPIP